MTTESGAVATTAAPEEDEGVGRGSGRWSAGTAALALAILLGLLLGFAGGLLAPGLLRPGDSSPEAGFARDMSSHHAQAVEMAILAHEKTTDPDVRTLAADIALTQQAQIGIMQTWLKEWGLSPTGRQPRMAWMPDGAGAVRNGLMPGMATDAQRAELRAATGRDFDALFLKLMLDHHLGGIHMAEGILDLSDDEQVTAMAESMVAGQKKEISLVRTLQGRIGAR
ncbi:DUF305 domain-containing protein [Plantactinospora sp. KLBMP9567]|uniref:DUF305 domain-containing protein n=1 Tax=Plantactinospora sp. KLBMP9567 TaxID=3085900 RepID=UPI002981F010|nr:DUF305 domain-containing protein [Plantactinospora sp. KLBMP9567]MDW5323372.1 DUF305 domain-containing protein [Plantactinospora sp. KLBMP9567]